MNWEAEKIRIHREQEQKQLGGEEAYRLHALQNLKLKTVVKESHCTTINSLAFNQVDPSLCNLFCTVGKDQATVYSDQHMGDYIGVVVHFTNQATEHAQGGELGTCCWVDASPWTHHPHGDACVAVAGGDTNISVISVVEARVVKLLQGHTKEVVELSTCGGRPSQLLSLARGGEVRLWDLSSQTCLSSAQIDATCIALSVDGDGFMCGTSKGKLQRYSIERSEGGELSIAADTRQLVELKGGSHSEAVDCIRYLPGGRLASKSCDGRMFVWDLATLEAVAGWKVPSCNPLGGAQGRCQFSATSDGSYICVGNSVGECFVYDSTSGARACHVSAIKVQAPVRACGLSPDCRHLVAAVGKGFLFRFEYLGRLTQQHEQEANKENGGDGGNTAANGQQ